ncbi:uncharacterized protein LOC122935282 [Bufo gargarizans]|uniref:uncharacterized protein LOC122935282 n=1 Tax=Bufo gargarizans TaxID=30331 RepID=UPI001CF14C7F|nr:uncharacterized protein LOC122935282 [Bufo gargarizans]
MEESGCDTETLIRLVQAKRCLYDTQDGNYKNRRSRQQAWEDIAKSIWPDWSSLTKTVKQGKVNTIKGKWKSLKDAFIRHRRKQKEQRSGSSPGGRSSYVHAAQMSFLISCTEMRSTDSSWEPSQAQADEEEDEGTMDSEPGPSMGPMSPPAPPPTPTFVSPMQTVQAVPEATRQTRHKRRRTERQEDRLIGCLDALAHPVPKLSSDAYFLLSLEEKMLHVPRHLITKVREEVTNTIDKYCLPYELATSSTAPHSQDNGRDHAR